MAIVALVPIFIVGALFAPELVRSHRPLQPTTVLAPTTVVGESIPADPAGPRADGESAPLTDDTETDLYGNDVNDAVAEYGLDAGGSLYEMHAPQVELPRLPSPKS